MFKLNSNTLYFLLTAITLLFTGSVIADDYSQKQKSVYKVDFDNKKTQTKVLNNTQNKASTADTENTELKILLFGRGHALLLEPDAINNTKLKYGDTEESLQAKVTELENQGIKYIICEPPATNTKNSNKNNIYNTNISNTTSDSELTRLRAMGYKCVEPQQAMQ
jgi:intracellular sulfur oxidation DsrE/DsrF family protein